MVAPTHEPTGATAVFAPVSLELRGGRRVAVREISGDDRDGVTEAFQHLSADARYSRFMAPLRELSPAMLERVVHPRGERDLALVAVDNEGSAEVLVGGARFVANPDGESCEFAVTLMDGWRGVGLARQLMELIIGAARVRGFRVMEGFILTSNGAMRGLAKRLGFTDVPEPEDATVRVVRLALD